MEKETVQKAQTLLNTIQFLQDLIAHEIQMPFSDRGIHSVHPDLDTKLLHKEVKDNVNSIYDATIRKELDKYEKQLEESK